MSHDRVNLLQGTLDVLVLQALSDGPLHGYAVSRWVRERTSGTLQIEDAPLYKALHRLDMPAASPPSGVSRRTTAARGITG